MLNDKIRLSIMARSRKAEIIKRVLIMRTLSFEEVLGGEIAPDLSKYTNPSTPKRLTIVTGKIDLFPKIKPVKIIVIGKATIPGSYKDIPSYMLKNSTNIMSAVTIVAAHRYFLIPLIYNPKRLKAERAKKAIATCGAPESILWKPKKIPEIRAIHKTE